MVSGPSLDEQPSLDERDYVRGGETQTAVKILVVGHFAVGKTTFIGSISDIEPLSTERILTMSFIEGTKILSTAATRSDPKRVARLGLATLMKIARLFKLPGQAQIGGHAQITLFRRIGIQARRHGKKSRFQFRHPLIQMQSLGVF